jgi:UPF0042 nucleotide-binding protein
LSSDSEGNPAAQVLVFGPPGAGAPLVAGGLSRAGLRASSWEGGQEPNPAADPAGSGPGSGTLLMALEAHDLCLLQRAQPPWTQHELSTQVGLAVRDLERSRERIFPARLRADLLLDTSQLSQHQLLARVRQLEPFLGGEPPPWPVVVVESFAFPRGVPLDLGWCVDARALRNPYWEPGLRMRSGLDPQVQEFVLIQPLAGHILANLVALVERLVPELQARSCRVLRLAVGCSGGFHRSVVITEELGRRLKGMGVESLIWHRDLDTSP